MSSITSVTQSLRNSKISTAVAPSDETNKEKTCMDHPYIDPFGREMHPNTVKVNVEKPCHDPAAIKKLDNMYLREVLEELLVEDILLTEKSKRMNKKKTYKKVPKTMM